MAGVIPLTEFPRQVRLDTTLDPLEVMIFTCSLKESQESRWKPSQRIDFGAASRMGMPLMDETRGGLGEGPFLQEKCMRSDLPGLKVMPINPKSERAQSRVAESKVVFSARESEMAKKPRSSMYEWGPTG